MAKKITELPLISAPSDSVQMPVDDTLQTYRMTGAQLKAWILAAGNVVTATINDLAVTTAKLAASSVTDAKTSFTKPTVQRFTSGSGVYTTPANVKYIRVRMVGGGAGGKSNTTDGADGTDSTFGTILTAGKGLKTTATNGIGGVGGSNTISGGTTILDIAGQNGHNGSAAAANSSAGQGGSSFFGGGGAAGTYNQAGGNAKTNTGSGGGGGGNGSNQYGGGGAAGYIESRIDSPSATYAYTVGAGGTNGTGTYAAGTGAAGLIVVEEYYQ